jgi:hypothetical protein
VAAVRGAAVSARTPGPWRVEGRFVVAGVAKCVAEIPSGGIRHGKVDEANAHQIAAAPELLAALREARDCALESDRARNTPGWERLRAIVEAGIAKVGGAR